MYRRSAPWLGAEAVFQLERSLFSMKARGALLFYCTLPATSATAALLAQTLETACLENQTSLRE
jgi:hypothetical protein